jgi:hypothetical protein
MGGGESFIFPIPAFQDSVASVVGRWRGVPDLSLEGSEPVYSTTGIDACGDAGTSSCGKGWYVVRGTGGAAAEFAGIVAIADDFAGKSLGYINPSLYAMEAAGNVGIVDVMTGNADGYAAAHGFDLATGVGTIGARFVPELVAPPSGSSSGGSSGGDAGSGDGGKDASPDSSVEDAGGNDAAATDGGTPVDGGGIDSGSSDGGAGSGDSGGSLDGGGQDAATCAPPTGLAEGTPQTGTGGSCYDGGTNVTGGPLNDYLPGEMGTCGSPTDCPCPLVCVNDPTFLSLGIDTLRCERPCQTNADCPRIDTVCATLQPDGATGPGYCTVNSCKTQPTGSACNSRGCGDGDCTYYSDVSGYPIWLCQTASTTPNTTCDPLQITATPPSGLCGIGEQCSPDTDGGAGGTCEAP